MVDFQMGLSCLPPWIYQSFSGMDSPFVLPSCCQSTCITHCFFPKIHVIGLLCTMHCHRKRDGIVFINFILSGHRIPWYKLSLDLSVLPFLQLSLSGTICSYVIWQTTLMPPCLFRSLMPILALCSVPFKTVASSSLSYLTVLFWLHPSVILHIFGHLTISTCALFFC